MAKILIVYTTSLGSTLKMARAVADGARSVTEVDLKSRYGFNLCKSIKSDRTFKLIKNNLKTNLKNESSTS